MKYGPIWGICTCSQTPDKLIECIREFKSEGAHGAVLNLEKLDRKFWSIEFFRQIFTAVPDMGIYACFYRDEQTKNLTDDDRAKYLLMAAEAGADIVDVMGDLFDSQPNELTMNSNAIDKQKKIIAEIKKFGAEVLMSSHVNKPMNTEETLKYFYAHSERGVDISKAVFVTTTETELQESRNTSEKLYTDLPIPFVYVCSGKYGVNFQRFETLLNGSIMTFVRCYENDVQPTVKQVLKFLQRHTPWANF